MTPFTCHGTVTSWPSNRIGLACVDNKVTSRLSFHVTTAILLDLCISHNRWPCGNLSVIFLSFSCKGIPFQLDISVPVANISTPLANRTNSL